MRTRRLPLAHLLVTSAGLLIRSRLALLRILLVPVLLQFAAGQVLDRTVVEDPSVIEQRAADRIDPPAGVAEAGGASSDLEAGAETGPEAGAFGGAGAGAEEEAEGQGGAPGATPTGGGVVALLMIALAHVLLLVGVQRLVLLGPGSAPATGLPAIGLRELRVLTWFWLQLLALIFLVTLLASLAQLGFAGYVLIALAAAWLLGRFALVFPGLAVDRPLPLAKAWARGAGSGAELAMMAAGLPFLGGLVLLPLLLSEFRAVHYLAGALGLAVSCWSAAAIALAWRHLDGDTEREPSDSSRLSVDADAVLGLIRIALRLPLEPDACERTSALTDYQGRLRGALIELSGAPADGQADAVASLLIALPALREHGGALQRVALVGDPGWAGTVDALRAHSEGLDARWFPVAGFGRAQAWSTGEGVDR